jgi:hypothetical protein
MNMSFSTGLVSAVSWTAQQVVPSAQAQTAGKDIVDHEYQPNLPEGTKYCSPDSVHNSIATTEGKRHVARDLLQQYFFGDLKYKEVEGRAVAYFVTDGLKYPANLSAQEKMKALYNTRLLDDIYTLLAAANGNKEDLYFKMFDEKGVAYNSDYGKYLYTCGARNTVNGKNPNADALGTIDWIFTLPKIVRGKIAGERPTRNVPVTQIMKDLDEFKAWLTANAHQAAQPKIDSLAPAVIYAGRPQIVKINGSDLKGAEVTAAENCRATISKTTVKSDKLVSFNIKSDAQEGLPITCALTVKTNGGTATGNLEIKEKPAVRTVKAEAPTVETVPAKKTCPPGPAAEALRRAGLCD